MEPKIKKLIEQGKSVGLSAQEKATMRAALSSYIQEHPAPASAKIISPYTGFFTFASFSGMRFAAVALVAILFVGGGTTFAAEGTLPTDFLYPVKIHVTEPLQGALTFKTESKARFNAEIAERRLDEAETLIAEGAVTASQEEDLHTHFTKSVERFEAASATLQETDPTTAAALSADVEGMLSAHTQILNHLADAKRPEALKALRAEIGTRTGRVAEHRRALNESIALDSSLATKKASEVAFQEVEGSAHAPAPVAPSAKTSLMLVATESVVTEESSQTVDSAVAEGKENLDKGAYGKAFVDFQKARGILRESERLTRAEGRFGITIDRSGAPPAQRAWAKKHQEEPVPAPSATSSEGSSPVDAGDVRIGE